MDAASSTEAIQRLPEDQARTFPCEGCGADLEFNIKVQQLKCPYCGFEKEIDLSEEATIENKTSMPCWRNKPATNQRKQTPKIPSTPARHAAGTMLFQNNIISTECPYCGTPVQKDEVHGLHAIVSPRMRCFPS